MQNLIYVFIGSGIGGVIRYVITIGMRRCQFNLPIHTLLANMIACFVLGWVISRYSLGDSFQRLFIAVGVCGGLSTYSTFSYELLQFIQHDNWTLFVLYATITFVVCIVITLLGYKLGIR